MQEIRASIFAPAISAWVEEARELVRSVHEVEATCTALEIRLGETREEAQRRRMAAGALLNKVRESLPRRGTREDGWKAFLEAIELDDSTAHRWMDLADPLRLTVRSNGAATAGDDRAAPPHTDADAPPDVDSDQPEPKENRDAWCTNEDIASALPKKLDLDPCSNPYSIVKAKATYQLERSENGCELPWFGLVYVNGPYSELLPWAEKLDAELVKPRSQRKVKGAGFLVNVDNSPAWWHLLTKHLHLRLDFDKRLEFIPPPGIKASKNDRPQTLLMSPAFWAACDRRALLQLGTLWSKQTKA